MFPNNVVSILPINVEAHVQVVILLDNGNAVLADDRSFFIDIDHREQHLPLD